MSCSSCCGCGRVEGHVPLYTVKQVCGSIDATCWELLEGSSNVSGALCGVVGANASLRGMPLGVLYRIKHCAAASPQLMAVGGAGGPEDAVGDS